MTDKIEKIPAFAVHEMLQSEYKCRPMPEQAPEDPLCPDMDEGYAWYLNQHGLLFSVPPPDDGEAYTASMLEEIMESGQLRRIVQLHPKDKDEKEAS